MQISKKPYPIERLLSVATYLTAGGVGFVWLIIAAFLRKQVAPFLMYHIMQSIFLSITYVLATILANMLLVIIYRVPIINIIPVLLNTPIEIMFGLSLIQALTTSVILYLAITSGMGYYSYLPWFSEIVKGNTGIK